MRGYRELSKGTMVTLKIIKFRETQLKVMDQGLLQIRALRMAVSF